MATGAMRSKKKNVIARSSLNVNVPAAVIEELVGEIGGHVVSQHADSSSVRINSVCDGIIVVFYNIVELLNCYKCTKFISLLRYVLE